MRKMIVFMAFFVVFGVAAAAQTPPKEINGGVLNGKALSLPKPEYPETAKAVGAEGVVYVAVTIDEVGNIVSAAAMEDVRKVVVKSAKADGEAEVDPAPNVLLRDAAERAAWQAKFSPTLLSGIPVKVKGFITYNFSLAGSGVDTSGISTRSSVLNGAAIKLPRPKYPPAAAAVRAEGVVSVQVTVDESGDVISATAVSGHPLLRAAAVEAARSAKFSPTLRDGKEVQVSGVVTYNFIAPKREN